MGVKPTPCLLSPLFTQFTVSNTFTYVVRLEAVLSSPHVAVGPSEIQRVDANAMFAKLGEETSSHLSHIRDMLLTKSPRRPRNSWFVPGEF